MDYQQLLLHSLNKELGWDESVSRLGYLSVYIFDFTTYDDDMDEVLAEKAVEVCEAITNNTTYEYIDASPDNYRWYIIMCNMPFFAQRIEWGTSIRGAWWKPGITLTSCGLWEDDTQIDKLEFSSAEWASFIHAVAHFSKGVLT